MRRTNPARALAAAGLLIAAACSGGGGSAPPPAASTTAAPGAAAATAETPSAQSSTEAALQDIRDRYADVGNRLQSFRRIERDLSGFSTEGGTLEAFFEGSTLRLVNATFYGETGRSDRAFYYDDSGRPFFVFERERRYEKPFGDVASTREYRAYFHEGRLIRLLEGERQVSAGDAEYASRAGELLELSGRLAEAARRP